MIRFGAFDPLHPLGVVSVANGEHIFGLRLLTQDHQSGEVVDGRALDWSTLRVGEVADGLYNVCWTVAGKAAHLSWSRVDERRVYGKVSFDEGLSVVAEAYVPWAYRLRDRWVNFVVHGRFTLTGEMIGPHQEGGPRAVRLTFGSEPAALERYNDRDLQLRILRGAKSLLRVAPGDVWNDMGLGWFAAAHHTRDFAFVLEVGEPEVFLQAPDAPARARLFGEAARLHAENLEEYGRHCLHTDGALGEAGPAVSRLLGFNVLYREDTGRRYVITDRPWARGEDDWGILFNWDTFLSSAAAAWFDPDLSRENLRSGLDLQLPDGRIPLHARRTGGHAAEPPILAGRHQIIVQALTAWRSYLHHLDRAWLGEVYPALVRSHRWWFADRGDGQAWRDPAGRGLLTFGYDPELEMGVIGARHQPYVAKAQYAYFETYDDSPQWTTGEHFRSLRGKDRFTADQAADRARYDERTHTVDMYTLERNCLYALESECLAQIAAELGFEADRRDFLEEYAAMKARINETMWDDEAGCYFNVTLDGRFSRVYTPDVFLPLTAGLTDGERADKLLRLLLDESKFWGEFPLPSVAKDDPSFAEQHYWRGQIWPPQVYLVFLGLRRAGFTEAAEALADRALAMFLGEWRERGYSPENYSSVTGRSAGSPHYNWGTLMGVVGLESCLDLTPGHARFGRRGDADYTLRNVRLGEDVYDVTGRGGVTTVFRNGTEVARGRGIVEVDRESAPSHSPPDVTA